MSHIELEEILSNIRKMSPTHDRLITILIEEESVYTNNGRLNRSALARLIDLKLNDLNEILYECQKELSNDR